MSVNLCWRLTCLLGVTGSVYPWSALGQIDPVKRDVVELGYNASFEGHSPIAGYAFFYRNDPGFLRTNLTLRLAVAPTYLDSELGISHALTENTDVGIGLAGGGFADNYREIDQGTFYPSESFIGHAAQSSLSVYHLFNPAQRVPLYAVVRGIAHYSIFSRDDSTAPGFELPEDGATFAVRSGLRWGGWEPKLFPKIAMEVSAWYEAQFRTWSGTYGYNDRSVEPRSQLFWGRAAIAYELPSKHRVAVAITAGSSHSADRFSAYRLGAFLPLNAEYPLWLPGYYYQEISAKEFLLAQADYTLPLDSEGRWNLFGVGSTAVVNYLPGLQQPGNSLTGVGGGILFNHHPWKILLGYGYGIDAIRSHGRGAQAVSLLLEFNLGKERDPRAELD